METKTYQPEVVTGLGIASQDEASQLDHVANIRDHLREQLTAAEKEYISLLPVATAEQFAMVVECAKTEAAPHPEFRVNVDFLGGAGRGLEEGPDRPPGLVHRQPRWHRRQGHG